MDLVVARVDDTRWKLVEPTVYQVGRDTFTIPVGYVTDFASVPRMLQWLAPSTGKYTLAAVLHDYLCDSLDVDGISSIPMRVPPGFTGVYTHTTSRDVDGLFRRVMREQGVPVVQRWVMWTGVRWGAVFNRRRRPGVARDLPLVLVLSVLALPMVTPALLCILFAFAIQFGYDLIASAVTK